MLCVDTHCHVQMKQFDNDRSEVLARAREHLQWLVVVGDDLEGSRAACMLTGDRVYAAVGYHPYNATQWREHGDERLRELAERPTVVAIGEIGLDYFNEYAPRAVQKPGFEQQLVLAAELQLPAVIHCREAEEDTIAILRAHAPYPQPCVMHCFGGDASFAAQCSELGCYISFAGNVTYPKAEKLREAARVVPTDRLLVETDAPYLAPQCRRGKRCEPADARHTLSFLAELKDMDQDELGLQIIMNAEAAFNISLQIS